MDDFDEVIERLVKYCESPDFQRKYLVCNRPRIEADCEMISAFVAKDASILDVGALPPLLLELLSEKGYNNLSVADPFVAKFEKYFKERAIESYTWNLISDAVPVSEKQFDLVCLCEVVEHLAGNLFAALSNSVDLVKPGGYLYVTTPNLRSFPGLAALLLYGSGLASKHRDGVVAQYEREGSEYGYYGHVREYTPKEIQEIVEHFGLRLVHKRFQTNYLNRGRMFECIKVMERFVPEFRLFGKYLFQKPE